MNKVEIKSNLRWAGGKSKMMPILDKFMPKKINKYIEIFTGGGSVLLHIIQKYQPEIIIANDINATLINYYNEVKKQPEMIMKKCIEIKNKYDKDQFKNQFKKMGDTPSDFFIKNKTSFSGLNTTYSSGAYENNFTYNSIKQIKEISQIIKNVDFINYDFENINFNLEKYFIYLDPPYYSNSKKGLYDKKGELHKNFNHKKLFEWIEKNKKNNKIMISYDDCKYIRELYKNYYIYDFSIYYSMTNVGGNNCKLGKEIIITNYDAYKENGEQMTIFDLIGEQNE